MVSVMPTTTTLHARATELLHELAGPEATFREHQLEAIRDLVEDRARVLCVQRTGWGKSAVYFIATALLRERGAGPTLIVSPLLALMRNQIAAARRLGIRAHTVNSTNRDAWSEISSQASRFVELTVCARMPSRWAAAIWLRMSASSGETMSVGPAPRSRRRAGATKYTALVPHPVRCTTSARRRPTTSASMAAH
ncbi:MAG: ATP-dependent helicase RecQ [Solirubrobacteraceae bacterium]|nr:ATP-dependent helicase RecQ [Solirubrobacteraceae bacterium]